MENLDSYVAWRRGFRSDQHMRNEREKQIFEAVDEDDVETLEEKVKKDFGDCRLGSEGTSLLSLAVLKGAYDVVKFLIDNGCDPMEIDKNGNTILHVFLLENMVKSNTFDDDDMNLLEILLSSCTKAVDVVFIVANQMKMTPFMLACSSGYDAIVKRFLALLENRSISIPMDRFIGFGGNNCFHLLLDWSTYPSTRVETVKAVIDKIPFSDQLIDEENANEMTPLHELLRLWKNPDEWSTMAQLMKIFLKHGADPDTCNSRNDMTYLERAILLGNVPVVECLLRAGCCFYTYPDSPLRTILENADNKPKSEAIRMIELLLAFGYNLQTELFLYTVEERDPDYFYSVWHTGNMDPDLLEAVRQLRQSNKVTSLQKLCRLTIRRRLENKADEAIESLTCIPPLIKSYLLVENEKPMLEISE